ncbi:MAG TPA: AbrB/MazE/SpoVT family DNA-binding domain-containing protein [Patescibacteria group bacterium]|nr:AbrB/MazE/SpoVT family DNA-binding domain-containing protein [Patescibacteria group bacterium]
MNQTVIKIGNSVGIILPQSLRKEHDIRIGDVINLNPKDNGTILLSKVKKMKKLSGLNPRFAQMVDSFMTEHQDVLQELAKK